MQREPFDFRDHVSPEWDESYQVSIFSERRWNKVRPVLEQYCPLLRSDDVSRRRDRYARLDRATPTESRLAELVREGRLADPSRFTLERVCGSIAEADAAPAGP